MNRFSRRKQWLAGLLLFTLVVSCLIAWQLPSMLAQIPGRYIARLPLPLQEVVIPEHAEILPTAGIPTNTDTLLAMVEAVPTLPAMPPASLPPPLIQSTHESAGPPLTTPTIEPSITPLLPTQTPIAYPPSARLEGIYHQFQDWNNCGPATLAMTLSYFGIGVNQYQTASVLKPNAEDRNVSPTEMAAYVNNETAGQVQALYRTNGSLNTLRGLVASGAPVIIEIGLDAIGEYTWMGWFGHYLLVVAYDDAAQQVWVYDSWFGTSEVPGENADRDGRILSYSDLDHMWRQFNRNYIVLFQPDQQSEIEAAIGADRDDTIMWQNALAQAQLEVAAEQENAFLWFNLGMTYNAVGDFDKAAAAFDQARSIGLPWRMLWYQFGIYEAYYQLGRYQDIVTLADTTLETQGGQNVEETYYYKALAQGALGDRVSARQNLERAVQLNPNFMLAVEKLAEFSN